MRISNPTEYVHQSMFWSDEWRNGGRIIEGSICTEITGSEPAPTLVPINGLIGIGHQPTTIATVENQVVDATHWL